MPATPPPNLNATAGAAVIVTDERYTNAVFSVAYPAGWRAITSPAGAPPSVTFAAPENCPLIVVSAEPMAEFPVCEQADARSETRTIERDGWTITLAGSASAEEWAQFDALFERIAESVEVVG